MHLKACPTFPCQDLDRTVAFYEKLGFVVLGRYEDEGYLLLMSDGLELHFWRAPDHVPEKSDHGCYIRNDNPDAFSARLLKTGLAQEGIPRFHPVEDKPWGMRELAVIDPDGNLLRIGATL